VGHPAPRFRGVGLDGVVWEGPSEEGTTVVWFLTSGCQTCQAFWHGLRAGPGQPVTAADGTWPDVVVTPSPSLESRRAVEARAPGALPVVMDGDVWHAYAVNGAPWFVAVVDGLVVAEGTARSWGELRRLLPARQ
jgi:hypothetical protein